MPHRIGLLDAANEGSALLQYDSMLNAADTAAGNGGGGGAGIPATAASHASTNSVRLPTVAAAGAGAAAGPGSSSATASTLWTSSLHQNQPNIHQRMLQNALAVDAPASSGTAASSSSSGLRSSFAHSPELVLHDDAAAGEGILRAVVSGRVGGGGAGSDVIGGGRSGLRRLSSLTASAAPANAPNVSLTLQRAKERDEQERLEEEADEQLEENDENLKDISSQRETKLRYQDFSTIDWMRDHARDQQRQRQLRRDRLPGWKGKLQSANDGCQGWLLMFLVGLIAGFVAGVADVATDWLGDIKLGVCSNAFYLNHEFCCWAAAEGQCTAWKTWADFHNLDGAAAYWGNYLVYICFAILFALLSGTFVKFFAPYAAGSGIPQVKTILGGFVIRKFLGIWTLVTKLIGLTLSSSAGLSLGKEGPFVHIVCAIGNICSRIFAKYRKNEAKKREVLSAAAAAGVSVAFGAPVGGVLFSLEEVSYYFPYKTMWRAFFCALTAATVLRYMNPFLNGRSSLFAVDYDEHWRLFEIIPFALLGVFGGLFGAAFIRVNARWCAFRKSSALGKYPIYEIVAIAFITAAVNYLNPYQRNSTSSLIRELFSICGPEDKRDVCNDDLIGETIGLLFLSAAFRMIITVFTFGLKLPAGLFVPSMAIGACTGRILGIAMQQIVNANPDLFELSCGAKPESCIIPGLYAMVGAAAVLGGVTRMTVSLVVIMFELTGGLSYVLPFMTAVLVSKWVGDAFSREGIYDRHIRLNGYPFLDNKEEFRHTTLACDVMYPQKGDSPLCVLPVFGNTVGQLERLLEETVYQGFPVVFTTETMHVAGYVARSELKIALEKARKHHDVTEFTTCSFSHRTAASGNTSEMISLRHCLDASPIQIAEHTTTEMTLELFRKLGLRYALVCSYGQLVGIITKKDLLKHMAILQHRDPGSILFN
ncbi:hypothetical protein, variant [Capsaspora owczarzaki ATCC 30864]|nr:hypothetical protein, variant [Capsaspora owczarzaki ATCC 30864]|eukprot:XP_011270467.1 hypothetical protein, variant [Capsaspora owczarzaki ATCC 30864]